MIDLLNLKQYREGNRLEAKKAHGGLPKSLWETYSSFANSKGGIILLGVEELKDHFLKVCGVSSEDKLLAEFWNIINNSKKVSVNLLRDKDVQVHILEDAEVISITVPRADRRDKPVYIDNDIFRIDIESAIGGGISDPRNVQIMRMFALVGICERVGSGLYNIFDVWEKSGLAKPIIEEKFNPDRIVLTLMTSCEVDDVDVNVDVKLSSTENQIYQILKDEPRSTMLDIADRIGKTKKTVERAIHKFKANNLIQRIGSDKDGYWQIVGK